MRKLKVALVALFVCLSVAALPAAASQTTYYFNGQEVSNTWHLSSSYGIRYGGGVANGGSCLPSYAQYQIANYDTSGNQINTHRSNFGVCSFSYPLTSNGLQAKAACRIISSGNQVIANIGCWSTWS